MEAFEFIDVIAAGDVALVAHGDSLEGLFRAAHLGFLKSCWKQKTSAH